MRCGKRARHRKRKEIEVNRSDEGRESNQASKFGFENDPKQTVATDNTEAIDNNGDYGIDAFCSEPN